MPSPVRLRSGVTLYLQLYTVLCQALADGTYAPGSTFPSEPELVRMYRMSRTTVRRALARLEAEGWIARRRGSGTFVRDIREQPLLSLDMRWPHGSVAPLAAKTSALLLHFEPATLPPPVAARHAELSEPVFRLQYVWLHRAQPYHLSTTYIPERIARSISKRHLHRAPLLDALDEIGIRLTAAEQTMHAVTADAFAARHLKIALSAPLLCIRSAIHDTQDQLCAIDESLFRSDLCQLRSALECSPSQGTSAYWRTKAS